jgi:peroxiredoxin
VASAGDSERKLFIFAACAFCFLLFRALRRHEQPEPENVDESESVDESVPAPEPDRQLPSPLATPARRVPFNGNGAQHRPPVPKRQPEITLPRNITPLAIGATAPEFELPGVSGQSCSLRSLVEQGKTICLIFSSPYCDSCRALVPNIAAWMREHEQWLNIVVISRGTAQENLTKLKNLEASRILLQPAFELSEAYGVSATPAAVLIGSDGLVQSRLVEGGLEIKELISSSVKSLLKIPEQGRSE